MLCFVPINSGLLNLLGVGILIRERSRKNMYPIYPKRRKTCCFLKESVGTSVSDSEFSSPCAKQRAEGFIANLMRTIIVLVALVRHIFCYLSSSSVTTGTSQWEDISPILVKRPLSDVNVKKKCISFCNFWCEDSDMLSFFTIGEQILNALWLPATLNECMENTRLAVCCCGDDLY